MHAHSTGPTWFWTGHWLVAAGVGGRMWAERRRPGLLVERSKFANAPGVKARNKVLAPLMALSVSFLLVVVAGLGHHYGWSPVFPLWNYILGFILIVAGYTFAGRALAEDRLFSSVVGIQAKRGHVVCETDPYCIVRHPRYAGNILPLAGMVLALCSL